jgi:hypothetical protein
LLPGNNLVKADRMGMACGLELRCPFLDYRLVELAFTIPGDERVAGGVTKRPLRELLAAELPAAATRAKRMFGVPLRDWFRSSEHPLLRSLDDDRPGTGAFVAAFAITSAVLILVTGLWMVRLRGLGEIYGSGDPSTLRGTLFADYAAYKLDQTTRRRPDVLVLGSSRVMSVRAEDLTLCGADTCFYNAGGGMPELRTGVEFYRALSERGVAPAVLILGVDIWDLNDAFAPVGADQPEPVRREGIEALRYALSVSKEIAGLTITDPRVRGVVFGQGVPAGDRGIGAAIDGAGFRRDGSYVYSRSFMVASRAAPGVDPVGYARSVRECGYRFECHAAPSARANAHLDELLTLAEKAGTTVIIYTPVLSDDVADALRSYQPTAMADLAATVAAAAARHHARPVLLERGSDLGCDRAEFFDGIHPSEVCDARLMLRLLADPGAGPILGRYTDPAGLRALIGASGSPLLLVPGPP